MKIKITVDSTCDLSEELIEKFNIGVFPIHIIADGKSYLDGIEITPADVYRHTDETGRVVGSSAVNIAEYIESFSEYRREYDAVIHFSISCEMSTCYQNACLAAAEVSEVYVVDSRNLSTGIANLAVDAAIMAQDGMSASEIKAVLDEKKEKLDVTFVIDTLNYLKKGGRCSALAALGANMLGIKPCIEVRDGVMGLGKKYRGSIEKVILKYVEDRLRDNPNVDYSRVFVTDSNGFTPEFMDQVVALVREYAPFREVYRVTAGCVISSHCGYRAFGLMFYRT